MFVIIHVRARTSDRYIGTKGKEGMGKQPNVLAIERGVGNPFPEPFLSSLWF